jgi:hypothetical protein
VQSIIANVGYSRMKAYIHVKYTVGYIANARNKHGNTQCVNIKIFILGLLFIIYSILTMKPSQCLSVTNAHSQIVSVISEICYILVHYR